MNDPGQGHLNFYVEKTENMYELTVSQIERYVKEAQTQQIEWSL